MAHPPIILFTYESSVFGRKMDWYFALSGLKYMHCITLNRLPRPVLEKLGIKYRRIPILAIGRDIYCDTRLIINKLAELFPENRVGSKNPFEKGLEHVFETWLVDAGPFWRTAGLIAPDADILKDDAWCKDRLEMSGKNFDADTLRKGRPENVAHARMYFNTMEDELLADGRNFLLNGPDPTLVDIHGIWTFHWTISKSLPLWGALEKEGAIDKKQFPKTFAYVDRFADALAKKQQENGKPERLSDEEAIRTILDSEFFEPEGGVDEGDPLKLKKGQLVEIFPIDSGFNHHDKGELVSIGVNEVVIESKPEVGDGVLRIHYPRTNIRISPVTGSKL
jgi:glutathione S-transferase